ncbi:ATP-binding protein [Brevibacillus agri]|uniref:ATP-binding protein n=1 Tax=Brevibacillus agri TaxID=51101 RepID=UPI003D214C4F
MPHLFERFYRAEQSRNSSTGGSGLGLSIARQIIEGHGGDIWVKSKEGVGTSLFFTLRRSNYLGGAKPHDDAHPHH